MRVDKDAYRGDAEKPTKKQDYTEEAGLIYRHVSHIDGSGLVEIMRTGEHEREVLKENHDSPTARPLAERKIIFKMTTSNFSRGMQRNNRKYDGDVGPIQCYWQCWIDSRSERKW